LVSENVIGTEAIVDAAINHRIVEPHHVANMLAETYHETGGYMFPIKETVYASHKDKNPSDATVIARLNKAWAAGQLSWVKTPYWKDGWFGRGQIQLTHEKNYLKAGTAIGVDLVKNPDKMLDPKVSAEVVVIGMRDGLFTGKKLSDYNFPSALAADVDENPRRIINGKDGTDGDVAKYHKVFYDALIKAGYSLPDVPPVTKPVEPVEPPTPVRTRSVVIAEIEALLAELKSLGG
jgi:predicted chitinase